MRQVRKRVVCMVLLGVLFTVGVSRTGKAAEVGTAGKNLSDSSAISVCAVYAARVETNPKSDNEAYAYVTTKGTTMVSGDKIRYAVSNSAKTKEVSDHKTIEGATILNRQKIKYLSGYNVKGRKYRLKVKSYNYSTHVKGRWNS